MDKQMIEEARKLCPHYADGKCYYDVTEISYCDCECEFCWAVDCLKNAGYRKIPELPKNTVLTSADIAELLTIVARDTRKETAEKFAERLIEYFNFCYEFPCWQMKKRTIDKINKICKEFTGEENGKSNKP